MWSSYRADIHISIRRWMEFLRNLRYTIESKYRWSLYMEGQTWASAWHVALRYVTVANSKRFEVSTTTLAKHTSFNYSAPFKSVLYIKKEISRAWFEVSVISCDDRFYFMHASRIFIKTISLKIENHMMYLWMFYAIFIVICRYGHWLLHETASLSLY